MNSEPAMNDDWKQRMLRAFGALADRLAEEEEEEDEGRFERPIGILLRSCPRMLRSDKGVEVPFPAGCTATLFLRESNGQLELLCRWPPGNGRALIGGYLSIGDAGRRHVLGQSNGADLSFRHLHPGELAQGSKIVIHMTVEPSMAEGEELESPCTVGRVGSLVPTLMAAGAPLSTAPSRIDLNDRVLGSIRFRPAADSFWLESLEEIPRGWVQRAMHAIVHVGDGLLRLACIVAGRKVLLQAPEYAVPKDSSIELPFTRKVASP